MKNTKKMLTLLLTIGLTITACAGPGTSTGGTGSPETSETKQEVSLKGDIAGEITISCYDTMSYKAFLEEAARLFEEKYPDTKVHIETFSSMPEIKSSDKDGLQMTVIEAQDDSQSRADYISKVNTSLMSNSGADIYAMDILPIQKYAESGQLENLASYMNSDPEFHPEDYRENILNAVKDQKGTWFLPMDYSFDYYTYDSTLITKDTDSAFGTDHSFTVDQLISLAAPIFDGSAEIFNSPDYINGLKDGMFARLFNENYSSFVDTINKSAKFKDGKFEKLLESVKKYADLGYFAKGVTGQIDPGAMLNMSDEPVTDRFFFKPKNNFLLTQYFNQDPARKMMVVTSVSSQGIEEDDKIAGIQADENGIVPFSYQQAYGMNADSKNKQTAWAFLKFLLSEEMQISTNLSLISLPINNAAREQKAELILSGAFFGQSQELNDEQKEVLRQYKEAVEQFSDLINGCTIHDTTINDMIAGEVEYFFDGSKTAAEVADVLQSKVDLYLNE